MKIPKKIKLAGRTITLSYKKKIDDSDCLGLCNLDKNTVILKKGLNKQTRNIVFLHELLHLIFDVTEYEKLSLNEKFVCRLSETLYQIIPQIQE
jgi:Zn-dependent peptidase ImmA (M78 family)